MICVGVLFNANAQKSDKKAIKQVVDKFIELTESGDYVKALDYTYPGLFKIAPKELIAEQLEATLGDESEMKITMEDFKLSEIGDITKGDSASFTVIPYSYKMTMAYKSEDVTNEVLEFTAGILQGQFGEENVTIDEENKSLVIINNSRMLAIKDHDAEEWSMLELKSDQMAMMELILPAEVYEAIKE
jgi:hypothetical protein